MQISSRMFALLERAGSLRPAWVLSPVLKRSALRQILVNQPEFNTFRFRYVRPPLAVDPCRA